MPRQNQSNSTKGRSSYQSSARETTPRFLAVDFFCGAGGTTRGLVDAGGYVIAGIDIEAVFRATYVKNNQNKYLDCAYPLFLNYDLLPKSRNHQSGQQKLLMERLTGLLKEYRLMYPDIPLLFAICAPCQPFTKLSHSQRSPEQVNSDTRNSTLLIQSLKFVDRCEPELIFSENVPGIENSRYGDVWLHFRRRLSKMGYATGSRVVCASNFNVPQFRRRSILLGMKRRKGNNLLHYPRIGESIEIPLRKPYARERTVRSAIGHLPPLTAGQVHPSIPNHRASSLSDINLRRLMLVRPGEYNLRFGENPNSDLSLKCHNRLNNRLGTTCFGDAYTRMRPDRPSPTLTTHCNAISCGRYGHFDSDQVRGISLREAATLQSFPKKYVFYPTNQVSIIAKMIGNAVPPKLAEFFATYLTSIYEINAH